MKTVMDTESLKWKKNVCFSGKIRLMTGLHIGAGNESLKIGGVDSPVITTPVKNKKGIVKDVPYIPGSSLKGKLRKMASLVAKPEDVEKLFGHGIDGGKPFMGPTRIIIRDSLPTDEWLSNIIDSDFYEGALELKGENWIQPSGQAKPRFIQRVIPDVEFKVEIIITLYNDDDEDHFVEILKSSITALEDSYLGGSGTRGYGRIEVDVDFDNPVRKDASYYLGSK
ncbi:MAG: type III-A CRISPR-associated RAMP protein Csm3 [Candidatus Dormibacteria bacterium]